MPKQRLQLTAGHICTRHFRSGKSLLFNNILSCGKYAGTLAVNGVTSNTLCDTAVQRHDRRSCFGNAHFPTFYSKPNFKTQKFVKPNISVRLYCRVVFTLRSFDVVIVRDVR